MNSLLAQGLGQRVDPIAVQVGLSGGRFEPKRQHAWPWIVLEASVDVDRAGPLGPMLGQYGEGGLELEHRLSLDQLGAALQQVVALRAVQGGGDGEGWRGRVHGTGREG